MPLFYEVKMNVKLQLTINGKSEVVNLERLKEILGILEIEKKLNKPRKPRKKEGEQ